jgi:HSP20 family molecular chaperone IbpA
MQRQFFRLGSSGIARASWEPPVDVFEGEDEVMVVVALPGVTPDRVQVAQERGALHVRAERAPALAGAHRVVRQLEIPYGYFERRVALPSQPLELASQELTRGCLVLRLLKKG